MKQLQTRFLYSAVLSSVFFILCYGILNFTFIISVLLTIVFYIGGIFLFKKNDIRDLTSDNINNYYFVASKIANQTNNIYDEKIKSSINQITELTDQILISLTQRPKKVEQVFDFFDYYLEVTLKILIKYNMIMKKNEKTTNDDKFMDETGDYLESIVKSFNKQYKNMQESKMIDIDTEIKIFEKTSGIKKADMEVGEKHE